MRHFSLRGETPLVWSHSEVVITLPCHGSITGSNPVGTVGYLTIYIVRLAVRTQAFHVCNTDSTPVRCIVIIYNQI